MYKTVFIEHGLGGCDIQRGNTKILEETISKFYNDGYELVTITSCPYLVNSARCSYVLVFKSK